MEAISTKSQRIWAHDLEAVFGGEFADAGDDFVGGWVGAVGVLFADAGVEAFEVVWGCDDHDELGPLVGAVFECVGCVAWGEDGGAGGGFDDVAANVEGDFAFKDVEGFVFEGVHVQRRAACGWRVILGE